MSTTRFQLSTGDFRQDWNSIDTLITNDNWENIANIIGHRGDDLVTTTGADPRTITAASTSERVVDYFNSTSGNPSAGGVFLAKLANPTIALNGSGTADAPSITLYLDSTSRQDIRFQANIRDIDASADNALQQVAVQWRVADGSWNNVAYVADATTALSDTQVTVVDVTLPVGANDSASLEIRIITTNAAGNDEAVGIDDIFVSSIALMGDDATAPVLIGRNPTDPDDGATAVPLTSSIVLRFSEIVVAGTGSFTLSNGSDIRVIAVNDSQVKIEGATVTINFSGDLEAGTSYTLTAPSGVLEDTAGNDFDGIALGLLDFTTAQPLLLRSIGEIQGASHTSPFVSQMVQTEGVVTAIDTNGFYIQSALGTSDGNSRTSDGIFVLTSTEPTVTLGSLLRVTATVQEFRPGGDTRNLTTTQLANASWLNLGNAAVDNVTIGTGGRLPPNQIIDNDGFGVYDPDQDGIDFWESLEGMQVTINAPIAISNTNSFGETYIVASGGAGASGQSSGGGLTLAADDFNPERIQIDNDSGLFAGFKNQFSIGDRLSSVTGVVSYSFQAFELLVTQAVTTTLDVTATKEISTLVKAADKLSVASYNLENLSANDAPAKLASLASDVVNSLRSPDIIGVQEIQDADGTGTASDISGTATAAALIAAIKAAGGPTYAYVEIAPSAPGTSGGEPGGNIRNGYLYDPTRVTLVPASLQLIDGPAFNGSRKPLVAGFEFNGETITFINVHFTSRSGSNALWGAMQPPENAGDAARTAQGEALRAWIEAQSSRSPSNIVVLGDFNGFTWEGGISALTRNGLMQNLSDLLPTAERYSYQFEGNNQQLDHIIVTGPLFRRTQFDAVQINSQLPTARQVSSDHDAVLSLFTIGLPADTAAPTVTTFYPTEGTTSTNIVVTFNETIARGTGTIEIRSGSATGPVIESFDATSSARLIVSGNALTIDPTDNLAAGAQYFVVLPSGTVRDAVGNAFVATSSYDFTISAAPNFAAATQSVSTNEDTAKSITVAATDADNDTLTYTISTAATRGTTSISGGTITYTPSANYNGSDSFVVTASDGKGGTATQTVNVTVTPVNDAPTFSMPLQAVSATAGAARTIALAATDVDGDALTYTVAAPGKGTASISGSTLTYTPGSTATGSDSFVVTASDGKGGTATQTINATVAVAAAARAFIVNTLPGWVGSVGGNGSISGSNGFEDITVLYGQIALDGSFNRGGDIVRVSGNADSYVIGRTSASSAYIEAGATTKVTIPIGSTGMGIVYDDGVRKLSFSGGAYKIGNQTFSADPTKITSATDGTALPTGANPSTQAVVSLLAAGLSGGTAPDLTITGKVRIVGTNGVDVIKLGSTGGDLTFDGSFNRGGDIIILNKAAGDYSAAKFSGSTIVISSGIEKLTIPMGSTGLTLRFTDGDRTLIFKNSAFNIGDQIISSPTATPLVSFSTSSLDAGTSISFFELSGAGANILFDDDATRNSYVKITDFASGDKIKITGAVEKQYSFSSSDLDSDGSADDLQITFSDPETGIVNDIQILSVVSPTAYVFDQNSAIAAVGFNFISFG